MAGPASQRARLEKMGVKVDVSGAADWDRVQRDVASGKLVTVSRPDHYFTVEGYDPTRGYNVGLSGTAIRGGKEWMSKDELEDGGGGINSVLYMADDPKDVPYPGSLPTPQSEPATSNILPGIPTDMRFAPDQSMAKPMNQLPKIELGGGPLRLPKLGLA